LHIVHFSSPKFIDLFLMAPGGIITQGA